MTIETVEHMKKAAIGRDSIVVPIRHPETETTTIGEWLREIRTPGQPTRAFQKSMAEYLHEARAEAE